MISGQDQTLPVLIPDAECEHPHDVREKLGPSAAAEEFQEYLGIRPGVERNSLAHQLLAQAFEIVDFAVKNNYVAVARIGHGLPSLLGEIQNRQPPVSH